MNPIPIAPTPSRVPRIRTRLLVVAGAWLLAGPARGEGPTPPPAPAPAPVLSLWDGGVAPGSLEDSDQPGFVRWRTGPFEAPFDFALDGVRAIRFPIAGGSTKAPGAWGFELSGGDVLFGALAGLDDKAADLEVHRLGKVRVDRSRILRIFRWRDGADLVYNGPNGLSGWREFTPVKPPPVAQAGGVIVKGLVMVNRDAGAAVKPIPAAPSGPKWREESGQLLTEQEGATLQADVGLPARARIQVELSWKQTPDFILAVGVGDSIDEATAGRAFRFEVWEGRLVVLRETDRGADLAEIQPVGPGPGRAHLQAFLDQEQGRFLVYSSAVEPLADLKLGGKPGPGLPGIRLTNQRGDLRLERLAVGRWDGEAPRPSGTDPSRVQLVDGSVARGQVERFDAGSREFVVRGESGETRVAEDRVDGVVFARPEDVPPRSVRAVYEDGTRIGGDWVKVEGGSVVLASPGIAAPLRLPAGGLRALEVLPRGVRPDEKDAQVGTLEVDGLRLIGRMVDSVEKPTGGGLSWKPLASESAGPLRPGVSGRIVYREPAPRPATFRRPTQPAPQPPARRGLIGNFVNLLTPPPGSEPSASPQGEKRSLYLRTGDILPVEVQKIDERGVTFRTPLSPSTFVPGEKVKAVELAQEAGSVIRVSKAKRERLLTLPRMQKASPPTHLIRSRNGDILRGRLLAMDEATLRVEVRLEEKDVPRDRVSRIIWLHPDETDPSKRPPAPAGAAGPTRVQAVRADGIRLTFAADRVAGGTLSGTSEVLGACSVKLDELEQLLIGGSVEKEATQLAYQQWKLQDAPEPKSAQAGGANSPGGTESGLVGKPAPDFSLEMLDGKPFHLADRKGQVVVLDFWATWCGPCLQAMPQIDAATREFADRGVQLVAVNLQEAPPKITALLDRLKLSPAVALDRDGAVAEKYGANAIPQTVVIDREGKVTRVFVGGGPHLGDQLREALKALMPAEKL